MTVSHEIVGYDQTTERLIIRHDIPANRLDEIKVIAGVGEGDPDVIGSYPLTPEQVIKIGKAVNGSVPAIITGASYFLEPST